MVNIFILYMKFSPSPLGLFFFLSIYFVQEMMHLVINTNVISQLVIKPIITMTISQKNTIQRLH